MKKPYSFKLNLSPSNQWVDGAYPVNLVLYKSRKRKRISLGIGAKSQQWNDKFECYEVDKRLKNLHFDRVKLNVWIGSLKERCSEIVREFDKNRVDWTLNQFEKQFLNKSKHSNVEEYFLIHIDKLTNAGKIGNKNAYERTLQILKLFDSQFGRLVFPDIDLKYINKFDEYLRLERGCSNNTIKYYIKTFRALINKAIKDGDASELTYPFGKNGYSISDLQQETDKRYLPSNYIDRLKITELENYTMQWVRNLFLFSYYCQGMSFVDVASLTSNNILVFEGGKYIAYRRHKTEGKNSKIIRIKITEKIQDLLDWFYENTTLIDNYLTPIISMSGYEGEQLYNHVRDRYRKYNKHLKSLGIILKFEGVRLSSYMSRHSYAMRLKNSGIPEDVISEALGHKSLLTTKIYLDSFQKDEIAKANEVL